MTEETKHHESPPRAPENEGMPQRTEGRWMRRIVGLILAAGFLSGSFFLARHWIRTPPKAERRPPSPRSRLVSVTEMLLESEHVTVEAMGAVIPADRIELAARVAGRIVEVAGGFEPGGRFNKGDLVLKIEPDDYRLALERLRAALVRARSRLALEMG